MTTTAALHRHLHFPRLRRPSMRWSGALGASAIGACTFGLALVALTLMNGSLGRREPSIAPTRPSPVPPTGVPAPAESLATQLSAGRVGIGVPLTPDTA